VAVEQLFQCEQLARSLLESAQADRPGAEHDCLGIDGDDPADGQENPATQRHLGDQTDDVRWPALPHPGHGIADPPDLVPIGVEHTQAGDPRDVDPAGRHGSSVVATAPAHAA
jgi:hypothetical protein